LKQKVSVPLGNFSARNVQKIENFRETLSEWQNNGNFQRFTKKGNKTVNKIQRKKGKSTYSFATTLVGKERKCCTEMRKAFSFLICWYRY
jgi:hypothetical protein